MLGFFLRSTVLLYLLNPLSSLHWPSAPLDVFVDFAQKQFEHKSSQRQTRSLTHTPPLTHTHTHTTECNSLNGRGRNRNRNRNRNRCRVRIQDSGIWNVGCWWATATLKLTVSFTRSSSEDLKNNKQYGGQKERNCCS